MFEKRIIKPSNPIKETGKPEVKKGSNIEPPKPVRKEQKPTEGTGPKTKK
jgi:hypothetical protein